MSTWLRKALQYATLVVSSIGGLVKLGRGLRAGKAPSAEDARKSDERAKAAIEKQHALIDEKTRAESPSSKRKK